MMTDSSTQERRLATAPSKPVRRVVIPVGGTDREFLAQEQAAHFAAALDVSVTGVHVSSTPEYVRDDLFAYLEQVCRRTGVDFEGLVLRGTDPVEVVLEELDPLDLVFLGTERLGDRFHIGGVTQRLMTQSPGPVQIVRLGTYDHEASLREAGKAYTGED